MTEETWKPVVGFEQYYSISNIGRLRREIGGGGRTFKGRILKPHLGTTGYLATIIHGKHHKNVTIHLLVAEAFLGPRPMGMQTNHINGDKTDNRVENLEYVTPSQNVQHTYALGRKPMAGEKHYKAKLTAEQVQWIRRIYRHGRLKKTQLSRAFGLRDDHVCEIMNRTWGLSRT